MKRENKNEVYRQRSWQQAYFTYVDLKNSVWLFRVD